MLHLILIMTSSNYFTYNITINMNNDTDNDAAIDQISKVNTKRKSLDLL